MFCEIDYLKYSGSSVEEGIIDARSTGEALLIFNDLTVSSWTSSPSSKSSGGIGSQSGYNST